MELQTTEEVATELNIPKRTLGQWAYKGQGPAYLKIGRHRRYRREDVDAWLKAQRRGGDAA
jgi:excisionase family DNA binding protein